MTDDEGAVTTLTAEECWSRLREEQFGRLAVAAGGELDIYPINYTVDGEAIVFRTAPGTKLVELTVNGSVAFEIDGYTDADAWSVVAKGRAARIERQSEIDAAEALPLTPWIPTLKYTFVRIDVTQVNGRHFSRTAEPERW